MLHRYTLPKGLSADRAIGGLKAHFPDYIFVKNGEGEIDIPHEIQFGEDAYIRAFLDGLAIGFSAKDFSDEIWALRLKDCERWIR